MSEFRKKPVVIEAHQWTGENFDEVGRFCTAARGPHYRQDDGALGEPPYLTIQTLEGNMRADVGDWIIRGVKGEFYPCKPDIFAATYEPAVEARSDDAALVLPGDAIAANAALAGIEMERRLAPNRYLEGVRAGIAAAADALSPLLAQHACGGGRRFDVPTLESALDAIRALSPEAIAGADTTPSVARLRAIIAEASKQADPAVIEAAAQRFEREADAARAAIWPDSTTAPANGDAAKEERGCR